MKKKIYLLPLAAVLLLGSNLSSATAQTKKKPQLAQEGRSIEEIVPKGWEEQHTEGDLNQDGIKDLVLIALSNDPARMKTREDGYQYNFNPKLLAVYFGSPSGVYKLFKIWDSVVPAREDEYMDTNADIVITPKGAMDISYTFWTSMGTADTGINVHRYRFQSGDFYLIGKEYSFFNRMTGESQQVSINYLTGQKIVTTGNMFEKVPKKTKKIKLKKEPLRLLGDFGSDDSDDL